MTSEIQIPPEKTPGGNSWAPPDKAVDGDGSTHNTVQEAVDQDTGLVLVGPGTFNESVTVPSNTDQAGGVIRGVGGASKINGGTSGHALEVKASDVTVSDLSVETTGGSGNNFYALIFDNVSDPRVTNVTVVDSDKDGIRVISSTGGYIRGCIVERADGKGIQANINRGIIEGNYVGELDGDIGGTGIVATSPGTHVSDNTVFGALKGVSVSNSDNRVTNNLIQSSTNAAVVLSGTDQVVAGNTYVSNGSFIDDSAATTPIIDETIEMDSGVVTLSGGSATIATGVTAEGGLDHFDVALDPNPNNNNAADVKASARTFWDESAGEYKVEILEDGTNVGNPDIGHRISLKL